MIRIDLAKGVFQIDRVDPEAAPFLKRKLRCNQMLNLCDGQNDCLVGMEACAGIPTRALLEAPRQLTKQVKFCQPSRRELKKYNEISA
jgi:hypothetical protein